VKRFRLEDFLIPAVRVKLHGDESVSLRMLSVSDLDFLKSTLDLPPIELVLRTLAHQAEDLPDAFVALGDLPRPTLLRLARTWASHPSTLGAGPSRVHSFDDFKALVIEKLSEWERSIREVSSRLRSIAPATIPVLHAKLKAELMKFEAVSQCIAARVEQANRVAEGLVANVRANLLDPRVIQEAVDEAIEGKKCLDKHDYGFAVFNAPLNALRKVARETPDSRRIHKVFLERSRDPGFGAQLIERVTQSASLGRREAILRAALEAHIKREYALSVPCLYAQLEGILTDLLVIEGLAHRRGMKAFSTAGAKELGGLRKKAREYDQKVARFEEGEFKVYG
jgi:hypothetical protein